MSYLDKLLELSDVEEGALLEFFLQYKFDNNAMHYFFEGYEDPSFYNNTISNYLRYESHTYNGRGKYKLYSIHNDINWDKFDKNRVLLFTDRDYTELLGENLLEDINIYVTDYYSIENHLVCEEIVEKILKEIFHLTNTEQINEICKKFNEQYNSFFKGSLYVAAWIIFMRRSGIKIHLEDLDFGNLFDISVDNLRFSSKGGMNYAYLEKVTSSITPTNSEPEIQEIIKELRSINPKLIIRGKFEIWFLVRFITRLKERFVKNKNKLKIQTHLNTSNCIEILGARVTPPRSLEDFLKTAALRLSVA